MNDENNQLISLGDIVHRLNSPLGAMRMNLELFKSKRGDLIESDESLRKLIERIERDLQNTRKTIDEIRTIFRTSESLEPVSIPQTIETALSKVETPKSIEIVTEIGNNISYTQATESLIEVFKNLITNAIEAMSNKGALRIIAVEKENLINIDFIDTGRGVSPVIESSLFKPYYSTKEEEGHGLGLFWSRTYIRSIGGDLQFISSTAGKNTTFRVTLPISSLKA